MAEIVRMPLMTDTMAEGVIAEWFKEVGETVESGELIAEIETDKATMDFEAPEDGVLLYRAPAQAAVPVNALLAIIGEKGEDISAILEAEKEAVAASASTTAEQTQEVQTANSTASQVTSPPVIQTPSPPVTQVTSPSSVVQTPATPNNTRLKASPLAKRLAADNNIDITQLQGSGEEGRIIKRDIEAYLQNPPVPQALSPSSPQSLNPSIPGQEGFDSIRVSQMRKTIARRLGESKFQAPHFYLTMTINMDKAIASRKEMNNISPVKISFNDIIIKAAAAALRQHPAVNSSWLGDTIRMNHHIHIGMAVAVEEGLLVPVIRFADQKTLSQIAAETKKLAGKAKEKKLHPNEMQGNTFSISNLGMMGIDEFTAIINPPDACIMAVGKIAKVPVVVADEIKVVSQMKVTLSCDHRVVDGAVGARFLQTFQQLLEDPIRMLV